MLQKVSIECEASNSISHSFLYKFYCKNKCQETFLKIEERSKEVFMELNLFKDLSNNLIIFYRKNLRI